MELEYLTDELKHLVGWGAMPHRLTTMPTLRELVDLSDCPSDAAAGYIVRQYLLDAIDDLSGSFEFAGRSYPAEVLNRVYKLLLGFEGGHMSAPRRRQRAIILLKLRCQESQWRRPFGLERDLMRHLANQLINRAQEMAA